ncbi:MAG: NAD-dependent epimerase/dehydratase family protein [bacterium]
MKNVLPPELPFYKSRKIAITGGASFIGSHLAELLLRLGASVTVIDDFSSGNRENLSGIASSINIIEGDLRELGFAEISLRGAEVIFHLAAQHGGRGYIESHPVECMNNMLLDHMVYSAAAKGGAGKIVFASSACTYPTNLQATSTSRLLLKEGDANFEEPGKAFSDGEYGWAKLMGELQLRAFHKQFGIDGIACRIFTAYGERENESHAVVALIAKAAAKIDPYPIWGDGLQTRNFTYVHDTVEGLAISGAKLAGFDCINVGSSHHHTIMDLIETIFSHIGWRPETIKRELDKPVGVLSRASDNTKCREKLGWEPSRSISYGVGKTVDWYISTLSKERLSRLEELLLERK